MRKLFNNINLYLIVLSVFVFSANLFGQGAYSNARSMGMGGAYGAVARGFEATNWNPANLGLRDQPGASFQFTSLGIGAQNNALGLGDYKKYNGKYLTESDKDDLLNKIPDDGIGVFANAGANVFAFSVNRFALSISGGAASNLHFSKEFLDLALNGNQFNRTYDFSDTRGQAYGFSQIALSYGYPIKWNQFEEFSIGGSVKYLRGMGYAEVTRSDGIFRTSMDGFEATSDIELKTALGGNGFAMDLGAAARINKKLSVGWSLMNLGSISWSNDVKMFRYGITGDSITVQQISEVDEDSLFQDYDEEIDGDSFSSGLPVYMRVGSTYNNQAYIFAADYIQGFSDKPGISTSPKLAFGMEYNGLHILPLRLGFSVGGNEKFRSSLGFGLKFGTFSMNFATIANKTMLPGTGTGLGFALGFKVGTR